MTTCNADGTRNAARVLNEEFARELETLSTWASPEIEGAMRAANALLWSWGDGPVKLVIGERSSEFKENG